MRTSLAILALGTLAGCQNPSTTLVHAGRDPLPDLAAPAEPLPRDGEAVTLDGAPAASAHTPRTTTLDRSSWATITVSQPRGQVEVQPTYYSLFEGFSKDARATGRYPTAATALAYHGEGQTALQDGVAQPAIGIFWLATVPGQLIVTPPWTVRRQPDADATDVQWLPPARKD